MPVLWVRLPSLAPMNTFYGIVFSILIGWSMIGGITYLDRANSWGWRDGEYSKGQKYFMRLACGPFCWVGLFISIILDVVGPMWERFWTWLGTIK